MAFAGRNQWGGYMTSNSIGKNYVQLVANKNIVSGVALGAVSTYFPFALTFTLTRLAHISAASFGGSDGTLAGLGVAATLLAVIAIYDARKSTRSLLVLASVIFAMLGVLVSLTV
jgi:hypothetical protein